MRISEIKIMKTCILLMIFQILILCHWTSAFNTGLELRKTPLMTDQLKRRLFDIWTWLWRKEEGEDSFVGRCIGVARKLKFVMPLIVFKLGVIVTTLAFLTIFALKSLGILVLLLLINSSGLAAKFAWSHHYEVPLRQGPHQPQNVHLHIHPKDGHYTDYDGYGSGYEKSDYYGDQEETLGERLKKLNIYSSY